MCSCLCLEWVISATRSTSPAALSMREIVFLRLQKKPDIKWFHHLSSTCEFRQRVCATAEAQVLLFLLIPLFFSLAFLLFQSTAIFSLTSVLSLSVHLSAEFFSMALHFYACCSFTNIFCTALDRAVSSSAVTTICSHPFSLSDAFLLHGHFLICSALLHPDCAFRTQTHFPCSTLSFLVIFPGCS